MSLYRKRKTRKDALAKVKRAHDAFKRKVISYASKRQLLKKDKQRLKALLGLRAYSGPIRGSDLEAARKLSRLLVDFVDAYQDCSPHLRWYHLTLLDKRSVICERKPKLLLKQLKAKADKALRQLGLSGLVFVDVNAVPNHPGGGRGGSFMFHVHALAWSEADFNIEKAVERLSNMRTWSSEFGGKPADIREIAAKQGKVCFWVAYDTKAPFEAKNPRIDADGNCKLMDTEAGLRGQLALRLVEGLSHTALRDRFFSVGDAKDLREDVMRALLRWHRRRWPDQRSTKDFDLGRFWRRFWRGTRVKKYRGWVVFGSTL